MTQQGARLAGWASLAELAAAALDEAPLTPGAFVRAVRRILKKAGVSAYKGDAHNAIAAGDGLHFRYLNGKWERI